MAEATDIIHSQSQTPLERTPHGQQTLELHTGGKTMKVIFHPKGAQITAAESLLCKRQPPLRALSENVVDALGHISIDTTDEGGTWPALPFGRIDEQPIHGYAPLNTWAIIEKTATFVRLKTGGEGQKNFEKLFPHDVVSMTRDIQLFADEQQRPHLRITTSALYEHPRISRENVAMEMPDMAEHSYFPADADTALLHLGTPATSIPISSLKEEGIHSVTGEPVLYLNRVVESSLVEAKPGTVILQPDGENGRIIIMKANVRIVSANGETIKEMTPEKYALYQKPGSHNSVCIEPITGQQSLQPGEQVILSVDIASYSSLEEYQQTI